MIPLYLFPLLVAVLMPLCILIPYAAAIYHGQMNWWLPFISDTGGALPQSSLFSQLLDITAIMMAFSVFIEYKRIKIQIQTQISDTKQIEGLNRKNRICLIFGCITSLGVIIVGNFRATELMLPHFIGAFMALGVGGNLTFIMALLSLKLSTTDFEKRMSKIRLFFGIVLNISLTLSFTLLFVSIYKVGVTKFLDNEFRFHWPTSDYSYVTYFMAALFEWVGVLCLSPYFATFVPEFKQIDWKYLRQTKNNNNEIKTIN